MKTYRYTRKDIVLKINYYLGDNRKELRHLGIPVDFLEGLVKDLLQKHFCNSEYAANCSACQDDVACSCHKKDPIYVKKIENMPHKPDSMYLAVDALWDAMAEVINEVNKLKTK